MLRLLARYLVVFALLLSIGGHWIVLQSAAWTGMLVSFASQDSISEAVTKTFDGEHPCSLCKIVERSTKQDSKPKPASVDALKKVKLFVEAVPVTGPRSFAIVARTVEPPVACKTMDRTPPVPPPRCV